MGVALGVVGLASYGFLVVAARSLGADEYGPLSVLWSMTFLLGPGLFLPLEQEAARALVGRHVAGVGGAPVVRRIAALAAVLLGVTLVLGLAAGPLLVDHVFAGSPLLLGAFLLSLVAACGGHVLRGVLAGGERFGAYAAMLAGESTSRLALALLIAAVGAGTAGPYGLALAVGPLVAGGVVLARERPQLQAGPPAPWSEVAPALSWLVMASVLAMGLMNAGPIAIEVLADAGEASHAGPFLSGLVVARIPLFLFQAVQAALLPRLSRLASEGRVEEFRQGLGRLVALVAAVAALGCLAAFAVGPQVVELLFGGEFVLQHRTMLLLGVGSGAFMLAMLLSQASIALGGHRWVPLGWGAGVAAFLVAAAVGSDDLFLRVELGVALGGGAALLAHAVVAQRLLAAGAEVRVGDLIEALHDVPIDL